jgi:glycosyltransferase involved in cell wall biosynthesis
MLQMATMLPAYGIDTELVVLDGAGPLRADVPAHTRTTVLGQPRIRHALAAVAGHLRRQTPGLVLSSFGHVTAALFPIVATVRPRPRLVAREPNLPSLSMAGEGMNRWLRLACRVVYPRCDLVVASSERMAAELVGDYRVRRDRLLVLPNPIDQARIRARAGRPLAMPRCRRLFVASGRLVAQKGFDRLINIWPRTSNDDVLVLLGDGPERSRLEQQAKRLGLGQRVRFQGWDDNPWAWYARADAVLVPSRFEGMPNAALEALACGTPVIATPESGGLTDLAKQITDEHLRVVGMGDFRDALAKLAPSSSRVLRPSLLPVEYDADQVMRKLACHLAKLLP